MTATKFTKAQQTAIDAAVVEQLARHAEDAAIAADFKATVDAADERAREAEALRAATEPVTEQSMYARAKEWINGADSVLDMMGLPSVSRNIIAVIAGLLVAGGVSFACVSGFIAMGAALSITMGAGFLGYMLWFLAIAISALTSMYAFGKVQTFILDGSVDRTFTKATGWVSGLFSKSAINTVAS